MRANLLARRGRGPKGRRGRTLCSYALDRVTLAPRRLELLAQHVNRFPLVGNQLPDAQRHAILDPGDLPADLLDIGFLAAIPLALAPQARVLVAQAGDRVFHLAFETQAVARLNARHLLAAIAAKDKETAHCFKSETTARLSSRRRSGLISNTVSGVPAAAHTAPYPMRSRSMNTGISVG